MKFAIVFSALSFHHALASHASKSSKSKGETPNIANMEFGRSPIRVKQVTPIKRIRGKQRIAKSRKGETPVEADLIAGMSLSNIGSMDFNVGSMLAEVGSMINEIGSTPLFEDIGSLANTGSNDFGDSGFFGSFGSLPNTVSNIGSYPNPQWPEDDDMAVWPGTEEPEPIGDEDTSEETSPSAEDQQVDVVFEYLRQCANATLDMNSCLVYTTVGSVYNELADDDFSPSRRFLQAMTDDYGGGCSPPDMDENSVAFFVADSMQQCIDSGVSVSSQEFQVTVAEFVKIFEADSCWESLCGEPSDDFFKIMFSEVAKCAGVDLDIEQCILDQVFEFMLGEEPTEGSDVRRVLQQAMGTTDEESNPCDQPTEAELEFFVRYLLMGVEESCFDSGVRLPAFEVEKATSDLVTIFGSQKCWGVVECDEEAAEESTEVIEGIPEPSSAISDDSGNSNSIAAASTSDTEIRCQFDGASDDASETSIEMSFFYQVETKSEGEFLSGVEAALLESVAEMVLDCNNDRQELTMRRQQEIRAIAIDSAPQDVVSDEYECSAVTPEAQNCFVVEGKMSLSVLGSIGNEEVLVSEVEEDIKAAFDSLTIDDSNVVDLNYVGTDTSLLTSSTKNVKRSNASFGSEEEEDTYETTPIFIAMSGAMVVMGALVIGLHKMNSKNDDASTSYDEKSNDGNSTAHDTADMTMLSPSCDDRSEVSSISPSNQLGQDLYAKHFVLAEEEEASWRKLGVLPTIASSGTALKRVSEEPSCDGDSAQMSI